MNKLFIETLLLSVGLSVTPAFAQSADASVQKLFSTKGDLQSSEVSVGHLKYDDAYFFWVAGDQSAPLNFTINEKNESNAQNFIANSADATATYNMSIYGGLRISGTPRENLGNPTVTPEGNSSEKYFAEDHTTVIPDDMSSFQSNELNLDVTLSGGRAIHLGTVAGFYNYLYDFDADKHAVADIGNANNSSLTLNINGNSGVHATGLYGGFSSQAAGYQVEDNDYTGWSANNNSLTVTGTSSDESKLYVDVAVSGGTGWQANQNIVKVDGVSVIVDRDGGGIAAGRGNFDFRMTTADGFMTEANNNLLIIKNSNLGDAPRSGYVGIRTSAFAGYSLGNAENNILVLENSSVYGSVYGGYELQGLYSSSADVLRNLHANAVSVRNSTILGSIYGTATGNNVSGSAPNRVPMTDDYEKDLQAVNRRRGIVYLAGSVTAQSVYARYVHFGQYFNDAIEDSFNTINLADDYKREGDSYNTPLISPNLHADTGYISYTSANPLGENDEGVRLGQLVAGTYLVNTSGFRSSLASEGTSQSDVTNNIHNFWVAAYSVIGNSVEGDGTYVGYNRAEIQDHLFKAAVKLIIITAMTDLSV